MGSIFSGYKVIFLYGIALAAIMLLLRWLEFRFIIMDHSFEVYIGAIALIFTSLGIWFALKLTKPKTRTIIVEKEVYITPPVDGFVPDDSTLQRIGISKREWEVLELMAKGLSNQEIATQLYLSLNTIKTHSSNLFEKLDVKRRTQAIEKAKRLGILA
ncbi:response regulator transcription factor [Flavihumibacter fluvii]|uniref:response regulator transcription factor n=1 Tax=Flavihumibacter fluvii TaxID=2838157 RepID=UPI001BDF4BC0|nr:LuxR C-terminal-related transcriptional regulator [Flavihumibacter fluvii]ULQ52781.1 LuxR C-terminal-related transcriptional regulator [Flavihumibacter fluvii]